MTRILKSHDNKFATPVESVVCFSQEPPGKKVDDIRSQVLEAQAYAGSRGVWCAFIVLNN